MVVGLGSAAALSLLAALCGLEWSVGRNVAHFSDNPADYPTMARFGHTVGVLFWVTLAVLAFELAGGMGLLTWRGGRRAGVGILIGMGAAV